MASEVALNLVIGLTDKASGPLKSLAGSLGTLGKIGGAAFLGGAVAGVGALSAALITGIGDAREANIIMAQTEAVIKSTGGAAGVTAGHIADLSGALSAASGKSLFGDSQIQESANLLLTFTNLKGGVLDAATAMSVDLAQAMGGAPADAALQLGKALNDPIAGIGALSRVGVTFTEEQKKVIKSLQEGGDMAGAQAVILAELNKEFGGSAAAAAAADGGLTQFKDRMGELAESIGAQVLPALNGLMAWLNSPGVQAGIENVIGGLVNGFTALIPILGGVTGPIADVIDWIIRLFNPEYDAGEYANSWSAAFNEILIPAFNSAKEMIGSIAAVVLPALGLAFEWISGTALPAVQSAFQTVWPIVQNAVSTVVDFVKDNVIPILAGLAAVLITVVVPAFLLWVGTAATAAAATILALAPVLLPIAAIGLAVGLLFKAWETDWGGMRTTLTDWWTGTVQPILATVKAWIDVHLPAANAALKAAWEKAWAAIQVAVQVVYDWLSVTVWPWITAAFALLTDTVLPTLATAFETAWTAISTAVTTVYTYFSGTVWPWLQTAMTNIVTWINIARDGWNTAWTNISSAVTVAKDIIIGVIDSIKATVRNAIDMINNLISLINSIPGVDVPTVGGGNDQSGKSLNTPRTAYTATPSTTTQNRTVTFQSGSIVINNPRNAEDVSIGLQQALRSAGLS